MALTTKVITGLKDNFKDLSHIPFFKLIPS